jgi:hypothetical protein
MKILKCVAAATALLVCGTALAQTVPNPSPAQVQAARARQACGDPWVTIALESLYGRVDRLLCDTRLYVGGRWSSYDQLLRDVRAKNYGIYSYQPMRIGGEGRLSGQMALGVFRGGNLVAAGGGNLVAAGGGNLVAAGGGNVLYILKGTLVSPGGGSYRLQTTEGRIAPVIG